jgi:hypothetical protein
MRHSKNELPQIKNRPGVDKIVNALLDLGEDWMYNSEFKEYYDISPATVTRYKSKFPKNILPIGSTWIWSGSEKTINTIREKLNG